MCARPAINFRYYMSESSNLDVKYVACYKYPEFSMFDRLISHFIALGDVPLSVRPSSG